MNRQQCCQLLPPSRRQTLRNGCLKVRQLWWTKKLEKATYGSSLVESVTEMDSSRILLRAKPARRYTYLGQATAPKLSESIVVILDNLDLQPRGHELSQNATIQLEHCWLHQIRCPKGYHCS